MKKFIMLLSLLTLLICSMAIVAYATIVRTVKTVGNYSLKGVLEVEPISITKKDAAAMTVNTTSNLDYIDSRTYALNQAIKNGSVIKSATALSGDIKVSAIIQQISASSFRGRFYLVEPDKWSFRVISDWVTVP